jgi:hypothetical protein
MASLSSYTAVKTNLFVNLEVQEYRSTPSGSFTQQTFRFTDSDVAVTIDSDTYTPLGQLLTITPTTSEIRPSNDSITISISGVPAGNITDIINSKIKGSLVEVRRQFRQINNGFISTQGYFFGRVNNWSIQEEYNVEDRTANNIILFECSNHLSVLKEKISGRKTNPNSNKRFFPNDTGMDRVPIIKGTKLDFGAPQ